LLRMRRRTRRARRRVLRRGCRWSDGAVVVVGVLAHVGFGVVLKMVLEIVVERNR
jgi:hypothetical protein